MFEKTFICGSPRANGRSQKMAESLFAAEIENDPTKQLAFIIIADMEILGCDGCNGCKDTYSCVIDDEMQDVYEYINESKELVIISPIYMAGVPSQFKAFLDRLQPYFWSGARHGELRKASVHLIGEGADPFGADAALTTIRSALLVAGYEVEDVETHIDKPH